MPSVAFSTKTWAGDYARFLSGAFDRKTHACGCIFDFKTLVINNGVPEGIDFLGVSDWSISANLAKPIIEKELGVIDPNVYAVGELAAIVCVGMHDYLVWVQGDCLTEGGDWVTPAIEVLESEPDVLIVSPLSEVNTRGEYDQYCSDQAFVCRVSDLLKPEVYSHRETDPDYPPYGGMSFEHMVGNYMKATGRKRKILSNFWVHHPQY